MIFYDESPLSVPPPRDEPPAVEEPPRPIAPAKSRWVKCPHCGSPAATLAVTIGCTWDCCRWYSEAAYWEWRAAGKPGV